MRGPSPKSVDRGEQRWGKGTTCTFNLLPQAGYLCLCYGTHVLYATATYSSLASLRASSIALMVSSHSFHSASTATTRIGTEEPWESTPEEGVCRSDLIADGEGGSRWA